MCQQCVDAVREHFPSLPDDEYGSFLNGATAFGFATADVVVQQVAEMAERSGGNPGLAMVMADEDTERQMAALAARDSKKGA